jgi:sec-independent protein translocase protein TatA
MDLLSPVHLGIILIVALLIFGPKRLPELGQGLGKTIRDFRKAMQETTPQAEEAPATPPTLPE